MKVSPIPLSWPTWFQIHISKAQPLSLIHIYLEARLLDIALILHAEHGGGNNSTFTTHLVSSTGTDTYSAISAAIGSLKGPKHGGANLAVIHMMRDLKENVSDITDLNEVEKYLHKVIRGEANDGTGLIYGLGHAVYTLSLIHIFYRLQMPLTG